MTPSLVFDRVWKRFRRGQTHDSLRDLVPALARRLAGRSNQGGSNGSADQRAFWAIRDLSFTVEPGEALGIIGPNGAGKSTTLKLLNRIMEPTAGTVRSSGKIGALIEVSAGFHQDLTGRQNIFLQGAIVGMRKQEVARKFDEIVAFAGIEEFLDTPVKRYSSGMNARLGFSIAAHLKPDILIIDEVLAVGDAAFQQKAYSRIKEMATAGAPVVLVSHQLDRIAELCTKAILLERGAVRVEGTPRHCINAYMHGLAGEGSDSENEASITFESITSLSGSLINSGHELTVVVTGRADRDDVPADWSPAFRVKDAATNVDLHSVTGFQRGIPVPVRGEFEYHVTFQMNVPAGRYSVEPLIWDASQNQTVVRGPRLPIEVATDLPFYGEVQMNTKWQVPKTGVPSTGSSGTNGAGRRPA